MNRTPEPEVMDGEAQALAYARADFAAVNQGFVDDFVGRHPDAAAGRVVDLGCGPADIALRLAAAAPMARVLAIDASLPMLRLARGAVAAHDAGRRVGLICARVPEVPVAAGVDAVVSNSLVHHLPEPTVLWSTAGRLLRRGGALHVMDLFRPESVEQARAIVATAAADADPILQADFLASLLAAFTPQEVGEQLARSGLAHLSCEVVSERHWLVSGRV